MQHFTKEETKTSTKWKFNCFPSLVEKEYAQSFGLCNGWETRDSSQALVWLLSLTEVTMPPIQRYFKAGKQSLSGPYIQSFLPACFNKDKCYKSPFKTNENI